MTDIYIHIDARMADYIATQGNPWRLPSAIDAWRRRLRCVASSTGDLGSTDVL